MYRKNAKTIIIASICAFAALIYCIVFFLLPVALNSKRVQNKAISLVEKNFDYKINCSNLKFKISPDIKFSINCDYLYFDMSNHKAVPKKANKKLNLNLKHIKDINIKSADIILNAKNNFKIDNIDAHTEKEKTKIKLIAKVNSSMVKHDLTIGQQGFIELFKDKIYANNFSIELNNTPIIINGILNKPDFNVYATNLNASDVQEAFLFYMKSIKPDKNFIENFYDFKGFVDVDLNVKNREMEGLVTLKKFGAKFVFFNLPLYFEDMKFKFEGDKITSNAQGRMDVYPVLSEFRAENIFSKARTVKGSLTSNLKSKVAKFIPNSKINGEIKLDINYFVQNQTPEVEYIAQIKKGSTIEYGNYSTGLMDENKKIYAKTIKQGNNLKIDNYSYILPDKNYTVAVGNGLLSRKDSLSKFNLNYIMIKTNGYAPVDIIGSLSRYIDGGEFRGELKYNENKKLVGDFELRKSKYKNFYIDSALIKANEKNVNINANGNFEKSPFAASASLVNDFNNAIKINSLDLYLKQYTIKRNNKNKKSKITAKKIENAVKKLTIDINQARLKLDKLLFRDVVLENIEIKGSLHDGMIEFSMPEIRFAQGYLGAAGLYDTEYNSSNIDFYAEKIDSNLASSMLFGLKDQFRGYTNATMHLKTYDKLSDIQAKSAFYIKDGALTKLGSSEFIINRNKKPLKFKLQDIINIDIKKMEALTSDIQGYFNISNENIKDIEIYNENKYLSLFLEGDYNIKTQNADVTLWGRYNKDAQRGIRVLFVPLSWITKFVFRSENTKEIYKQKISKIPPVSGKSSQQEIVNVSASGNINDSKNLKVNLRAIK